MSPLVSGGVGVIGEANNFVVRRSVTRTNNRLPEIQRGNGHLRAVRPVRHAGWDRAGVARPVHATDRADRVRREPPACVRKGRAGQREARGPELKGSISNLSLIFQPNEQTL